jgi:hypothetical protein
MSEGPVLTEPAEEHAAERVPPGVPPGLPTSVAAQRPLPVAIYILAALLIIKAAAIGVVVLGASFEPLQLLARTSVTYRLIEPLLANPVAMAIVGLIAVLLLYAGLALLRRRRIGWLLAMVLTGVFVAVDIYGYLTSSSNHVWMLVNIITVFYLNQAEVRETVGAIVHEPDPAPVVYA